MEKLTPYAKFIVAIVGAGVTSCLLIVAPDTDLFKILTVASSVITAIGVYFTPNRSEAVVGA